MSGILNPYTWDLQFSESSLSSSGWWATWVLTIMWAWKMNVTGLWFRPGRIDLVATVTSLAGTLTCTGKYVLWRNEVHSMFIASAWVSATIYLNDRCLWIDDRSQNPYSRDSATITNVTDDWFTLLVDTRNHLVTVSYTVTK